MTQRTFLVLGSGGREHALAWKLGQAADRPIVFVAPGNDGIAADPEIRGGCVKIEVTDFADLAAFASERAVDLTIVGPEVPLCAGVVDYFQAHDLAIFGPTRSAAALEGSKAFAKEIMQAAGVPTAAFADFVDLAEATAYVERAPHPLVIKADGLAAGKGVVISEQVETSVATLKNFMAQTPAEQNSAKPDTPKKVVIEEFLVGTEMSFMVVTDGRHIVPFSSSQDHKRVGEGGTGPNTGGMGAVAPSPLETPELCAEVVARVLKPTLAELRARGQDYAGFLYAGLMLCEDGLKVLEFNCRMGDPETQALLFADEANADLGGLLVRAVQGKLSEKDTLRADLYACCVVLASKGYPGSAEVGDVIHGLNAAADRADVKIFHGGTRLNDDRAFTTAGGRVLGVTGRGKTPAEARRKAYEVVQEVSWEGMHYRRDIGG